MTPTPRSEQLRKINVDLRLEAEDLGWRAILRTLDTLEVADVSTPANFKCALTMYRDIAVQLGKGKPAAQRTSLLAGIVQLELPQRCFEDILAEKRSARKVDPLDDLDNEEPDESDEERECRCIQRQWQAFTTRSITVSRCKECRDG